MTVKNGEEKGGSQINTTYKKNFKCTESSLLSTHANQTQ